MHENMYPVPVHARATFPVVRQIMRRKMRRAQRTVYTSDLLMRSWTADRSNIEGSRAGPTPWVMHVLVSLTSCVLGVALGPLLGLGAYSLAASGGVS